MDKVKSKQEDGLTLIEVVASIVILSIVLLSFSSLFLQSVKHTKYNKEKLSAVEVAELVVADLRSGKKIEEVGYECVDNYCRSYRNENLDPEYLVELTVSEGPADIQLKKAVIMVTTKADTASKKSSFTTEMYFDEEREAS